MSNIVKLANHSRWTLMSSGFFVVLQALQLIIITHYISKESFGYLSISNAFVFLCISLLDTGVVLSIVQAEKLEEHEIFGILKFNLRFATSLCLVLVFLSIVLVSFYEVPEIKTIINWMLPLVFLSAYNSVFIARLKRQLDFKKLSIIEIFSYGLTFCVVIFLAIKGFEYMAIVYGFLCRAILITLGLWFSNSLHLVRSNAKVSEHLSFGKYVYGEKILTAVIANIDSLIIGKLIGMTDLGVYDVFKRIVMRPLLIFYNAFENVAFSIFSKLQNDEKEFRAFYANFVILINYLALPIAALVYLNAEWILQWFPTDYQDYLTTLKLFCGLIIVLLIVNPLDMLLYTLGKSKEFLKWMMVYSIPLIITLIMSAFISLNALIINATVFYGVLFFLAYFVLVKKETSIDAKSYFVSVLKPLFFVLLIGGIVEISFMNHPNLWIKLFVSIGCYLVFYLILVKKELKWNPLSEQLN